MTSTDLPAAIGPEPSAAGPGNGAAAGPGNGATGRSGNSTIDRSHPATPGPGDRPELPSAPVDEPAEILERAVARAFRIPPVALLATAALLVIGFWISVSVGASDITGGQVIADLADRIPGLSADSGLTDTEKAILWQWRMPRAVLGALVGAALAMSGATFQGVFRNPLADPYLLGVAAGAGLGATLAIVAGADAGWGPVHAVPLAAFAGALLAVVASAALGFGASRSAASLLLAGVAVASFLTAVQTFVMQRNTDVLAEVYSWILGRLGTFGWTEVSLLAPYVAVCGLVTIGLSRHLDVMQLGDDEAQALGINVTVVRAVLVVAASLLAAAAVSVSGLIAFVGIIVPHFVRLVVGASYRVVLPLSALGGAVFLVLADVGARTIGSGSELPIGVVTAFFGAPFFALVLWTRRGALR
jgi:iron complex transport system permease protein